MITMILLLILSYIVASSQLDTINSVQQQQQQLGCGNLQFDTINSTLLILLYAVRCRRVSSSIGTVTFATKPRPLALLTYMHNTKTLACNREKAWRVHNPHAYLEGMAASQIDEFNVAMAQGRYCRVPALCSYTTVHRKQKDSTRIYIAQLSGHTVSCRPGPIATTNASSPHREKKIIDDPGLLVIPKRSQKHSASGSRLHY